MPLLEKLKNRLADKPFTIVLIDVGESADVVRRYASTYKVDLPVLLDVTGRVSEKYQVRGYPVKFLIDKEGKLVLTVMGYRDWDSEEWVVSLEKFLKESGASPGK